VSGTARVTLRGRCILVTCGSKGIGREIALAAADAGAKVLVAARGAEAVPTTVAYLPSER
jgi:NAD(P)-dependent dehydrogenase (short-subunit alcohol dehydrogenase family)